MKKKWVNVEKLREEGVDLSDREGITVRFPRGWFCNNPPGYHRFIPAGFERGDEDDPVMEWRGTFYPKYNPSDERTVFEFPGTWLSRLPKRAQVFMAPGWEEEAEKIRAKREEPHAPATIQELRGGEAGVVAEGQAKAAMKSIEIEELVAQRVKEALEAIEAEKAAITKAKRQAAAAKAREAKNKKKT